MPNVFNWQIGREMDYPYEPSRPKRQFAMIMDLNKCIACQTCTVACKTNWTPGRGQEYMFWNNVESKPYGFYPLGWDVRILEKHGVQDLSGDVYKGKTLFEAAPEGERVLGYLPDDIDYANPNVGEDDSLGEMPQGDYITIPHMQWMYYLPRICNHCTYPACLGSCPRQSIYKRQEDGIVLLDQSRCRGYRECVRGCPYKKSFFNPVTRVSEKCIACYPQLKTGSRPSARKPASARFVCKASSRHPTPRAKTTRSTTSSISQRSPSLSTPSSVWSPTSTTSRLCTYRRRS
jgi:nitrate reductase beta subunit